MNTNDSLTETGDLQTFRRRVQRKSEFFYDSNTVYFSRYSRSLGRPKRNTSFQIPVDISGVRHHLRSTRNPVFPRRNFPSYQLFLHLSLEEFMNSNHKSLFRTLSSLSSSLLFYPMTCSHISSLHSMYSIFRYAIEFCVAGYCSLKKVRPSRQTAVYLRA